MNFCWDNIMNSPILFLVHDCICITYQWPISWAELTIHPLAVRPGFRWCSDSWCPSCGLFPYWLIEASWCESKPGVRVRQCVLSMKHCNKCLCHACVCKRCVRPVAAIQCGGQSCCPFISSTISSWKTASAEAALHFLWDLCVNPVGVAVPFTCSLSTSFQVH